MLIECSYCKARVDATLIAEHHDTEEGHSEKIVFLKCPACSFALLGKAEFLYYHDGESEWSGLTRVWPEPENFLHFSIPREVQSPLVEAKKCFRATAFGMCAVSCGLAIEAMCLAHTGEKNLSRGLKKLLDSGVIDQRLFEWGDSLRIARNKSAHASGEDVNRQDASDILDFALAICEYVYVLSDRYENYKKRKAEGNN